MLTIQYFRYTGSLFKKGYIKDLNEDDLYEVLEKYGSKRCGDKFEQKFIYEQNKRPQVSIMKLLWKRFGFQYLFSSFIDILWQLMME